MNPRFRAALYRNDGNGVRLLIRYSEETCDINVAYQFACDLKLDYPDSYYWVALVSDETCPSAFV